MNIFHYSRFSPLLNAEILTTIRILNVFVQNVTMNFVAATVINFSAEQKEEILSTTSVQNVQTKVYGTLIVF